MQLTFVLHADKQRPGQAPEHEGELGTVLAHGGHVNDWQKLLNVV